MAIFNSYVKLPEGKDKHFFWDMFLGFPKSFSKVFILDSKQGVVDDEYGDCTTQYSGKYHNPWTVTPLSSNQDQKGRSRVLNTAHMFNHFTFWDTSQKYMIV